MKKISKFESIYNVQKYLGDDSLLPIYFLFGEDSFTINNAIKAIEKKIAPLVVSDFDSEQIQLSKDSTISQFVDLAYSFPFGDGKKLIVVKGFEELREVNSFSDYVKDPAEFTTIIVAQYSSKAPLNQEPYKSLFANKYIFEARELEEYELIDWMFKKAKIQKIKLTKESGELLIEMVGNNKAILEMQLNKIVSFTNNEEEITPEIIHKLAEITKEYSIYDLQNAIGSGNKSKALEYAYNILVSQNDISKIFGMLTNYITTLTKVLEFLKLPESEGKKEFGNRFYYLKKTSYMLKEKRLENAAKALLEADIRLKSSNIDNKTNITILISEIMK